MWQYYQPNPCGLSTGDCTVRAISKALDISWDEAHDILSVFVNTIRKPKRYRRNKENKHN